MKIIHCADLHLDSKMETNLSLTKAHERKTEILHTFERMVDYAAEQAVNAIIIAGDMFDTSRVMNSTKNRVLNTIKKYPQIDFLYLSGNHDETNFLASLDTVPANLKTFGTSWTSYDYAGVTINGVVLSGSNRKTVYDTLRLSNDRLNIVVMHGQIGQYNAKDQAEVINLNLLKHKHIDYLALGHIHSFTQGQLDQRGVYCYAGCLEGHGFDECGAKGFVLLDTAGGVIKTEFVPFAARQMIELSFDITPYADWFAIEDQILTKVKAFSEHDLLQVVLQGKYKMSMDKHLGMLEQKLDRFYCVKIKDDSVLDVTEADVAHDISLRGEFVRQVLQSNLSAEAKEQTILVGLRALSGEDL